MAADFIKRQRDKYREELRSHRLLRAGASWALVMSLEPERVEEPQPADREEVAALKGNPWVRRLSIV